MKGRWQWGQSLKEMMNPEINQTPSPKKKCWNQKNKWKSIKSVIRLKQSNIGGDLTNLLWRILWEV